MDIDSLFSRLPRFSCDFVRLLNRAGSPDEVGTVLSDSSFIS